MPGDGSEHRVIVPIVEGDGETEAVPVLLRRVLDDMERWHVGVTRPLNAHGAGNLTKRGGVERFVQLARLQCGCCGVLVLLDAEGGCALRMARDLATRVRAVCGGSPAAVVCACREYEAWFPASLHTLTGVRLGGRPGLVADTSYGGDVEALTGVKGWLSRHFPAGRAYKETLDQAPMTARIDLREARERSRSFRRLCHAIELLSGDPSSGSPVTP